MISLTEEQRNFIKKVVPYYSGDNATDAEMRTRLYRIIRSNRYLSKDISVLNLIGKLWKYKLIQANGNMELFNKRWEKYAKDEYGTDK